MLTREQIHKELAALGIRPDDTVLMHTSMRALGEVEGGCDGLIDAFCAYLTDGLYLIPTHTWANVDKENPVYDVRTTMPCIGALPCVAAFRADGVRSLHPTHSITAFGRGAADFVAGEEKATSPCTPGGCWARLPEVGAKILLVGVGLNRNTFIHAIDEMLDLPDRLEEPISLTVIDHEGKAHALSFCKHGSTGSENFGVYREALEACGVLTYGKLGKADVICCDAARCTTVIKHLWQMADYDLCKEPHEIPRSYYEDLL